MHKLDDDELRAVSGGRDERQSDSSETTAHSKKKRGLLASCFDNPPGRQINRGFSSSVNKGASEVKVIPG